ncbi:glycosyltransferase family 39 protein [Candidatus Micrarchaeota archaeon]|nr:glycosyltransferase family 39 protein [Candidatus Micrarchaeota archaeon]
MIIELLSALLVFIGALVLGKTLLSTIGAKHRDDLEEYSYALMIGLIFYSLYGLFVSLAGIATKDVFYLLIGLSLITGIKELHALYEKLSKTKIPLLSRKQKILFTLLAILLAMHFLTSLTPPSANPNGPMDWDSLTYHLMIIQQIHQTSSFPSQPLLPHANWPFGFETIYLAAFSLGGVVATRILSFLVSTTMLAFMYSFAKRFVSKDYALLAVAIFSTIPIAQFFYGTGYIDLHLTFAVLLSINALFNYFDTKKNRWLFLSALAGGFAASIKLTGLIYTTILALWVVIFDLKNKNKIHHATTKTLLYLTTAFGLALPWFLKNYAKTSNPVWPLYYNFFSLFGIQPDAQSLYFNEVWNQQIAQSGLGRGIIDFFLTPFTTVFYGQAYNGIITPLILMFLPLAFFATKKNNKINGMLLATIPLLVFWFLTFHEARFLFPILAIASIACAYFIENNSLNIKKIAFIITIITLISTIGLVFVYKYNSFGNALGFESNEAYLQRTYPPYAACNYFVSNHETGQIFAFYQEALYYCERPLYSIYFDYHSSTPSEIASDLKNLGVVTIMIPKHAVMEENVQELASNLKKEYEDENYVLYELG